MPEISTHPAIRAEMSSVKCNAKRCSEIVENLRVTRIRFAASLVVVGPRLAFILFQYSMLNHWDRELVNPKSHTHAWKYRERDKNGNFQHLARLTFSCLPAGFVTTAAGWPLPAANVSILKLAGRPLQLPVFSRPEYQSQSYQSCNRRLPCYEISRALAPKYPNGSWPNTGGMEDEIAKLTLPG